jgi:hypothetical protein
MTDNDIQWFHIAVHNSLKVTVFQCLQEFVKIDSVVSVRQLAVVSDQTCQWYGWRHVFKDVAGNVAEG